MEIIKNEAEAGKLLINKLASAERQLAAAIRMYFMEEDPLAIHTLASAAHNLYADLLRHRGKDPAFYLVVFGLLATAKEYIAGKVSEDDLVNMDESLLEVLQPMIDMLKENPDLDIKEFTVTGHPDAARAFYQDKRHAYNFLKHADRDPSEMLDSAAINNEDIILHAIACSLHLNCQVTSEKEAFLATMCAFGKVEHDLGPEVEVLAIVLQSHSRDEVMHLARRNLCYSRVNDDLLIDFDKAAETSRKLIKNYFEKKNGAQGEAR